MAGGHPHIEYFPGIEHYFIASASFHFKHTTQEGKVTSIKKNVLIISNEKYEKQTMCELFHNHNKFKPSSFEPGIILYVLHINEYKTGIWKEALLQ